MTPIDQAIHAVEGPSNLAAKLGVRVNVVTNWRMRGRAPAEYVLAIEAATGISRHKLRPDVFGEPPTEEQGDRLADPKVGVETPDSAEVQSQRGRVHAPQVACSRSHRA